MKRRIPVVILTLMLLCTACFSGPEETTQSSSEPATEAVLSTDPTWQSTEPAVTTPPETAPPETQPSKTDPPETEPPETAPPERVLTVCIDAGHQQAGIPEKEPNGPGSAVMKAKLTSGTQGVATGIEEYKLNLEVSLLLEQELLGRGYQVVMIRRTNDCPLSNAERAVIANESGADIFVRIHANGSEDPSVQGMLCCVPTENTPSWKQRFLTLRWFFTPSMAAVTTLPLPPTLSPPPEPTPTLRSPLPLDPFAVPSTAVQTLRFSRCSLI